ncbi:MAG: AAA family ATPase, partial [Alphaproteobacteria bacterium]|nr:AAA family ATPase [Alphaproteobacteria bacterium]
MQFTKLRLTGFKSFVDPTELEIAPGITAVVGPNGCGKSNLFEALRWVMGETSAKRMRGSEMDDVIFGGTSDRPPRNIAEVVLSLDNQNRTAPASFNHHDELDVSRRIERGSGSDYRINGKGVRARDVQLLFQDHGSGAHSPALVSQGRVATLINAKATDRRLLLEEAAGIMGLHSRRHEAELKLKAAEENLVRLEDVIQAMEGQLGGLQKQAKQAARYRALSDRIREAEAVVLHLRLIAAQEKLTAARQAHQANEEVVREHMLAVTRATTAATEAGEAVEPLRKAEAEAAAALQHLTIARDRLAEEERRIEAERAEAQRRLDQLGGDVAREKELEADAAAALERLTLERAKLEASREGEGEAWQAADQALAEARATVEALETELEQRTEKVAADEAAREQLERRIRELEEA